MREPLVVDWDGTVTEVDGLHLVLSEFGDVDVYERGGGALGREPDAARGHRGRVRDRPRAARRGRRLGPRERPRPRRLRRARATSPPARRLERLPRAHRSGARARGHRARGAREPARPAPRRVARDLSATPSACPVCGEPCKRSDVAGLDDFVYVGDGFSDRCVAQAATRVFARDGLAEYLDARGVPYRARSTTSTTSATRSTARPSSRRAGAAAGRRSSAGARPVVATWPQSASTAVRAISSIGCSTVVSGGFVQVAASIPSNPTIERSSGTRRPCTRRLLHRADRHQVARADHAGRSLEPQASRGARAARLVRR